MREYNQFIVDLETLLNEHARESESNTPDFVLAQFLKGCLDSFDTGIRDREVWNNRSQKEAVETEL